MPLTYHTFTTCQSSSLSFPMRKMHNGFPVQASMKWSSLTSACCCKMTEIEAPLERCFPMSDHDPNYSYFAAVKLIIAICVLQYAFSIFLIALIFTMLKLNCSLSATQIFTRDVTPCNWLSLAFTSACSLTFRWIYLDSISDPFSAFVWYDLHFRSSLSIPDPLSLFEEYRQKTFFLGYNNFSWPELLVVLLPLFGFYLCSLQGFTGCDSSPFVNIDAGIEEQSTLPGIFEGLAFFAEETSSLATS